MFLGGGDARARLLAVVDRQMREAAGARRYERAAALRRRLSACGTILEGVEGVLAATHARPRLVLAAHPTGPRFDALWLAGGRLVDFGELPEDPVECRQRCERALARAGRADELGAHVPPAEIDELRIVAQYLAAHPDLPELSLDPAPSPAALRSFVAAARRARAAAATAGKRAAQPRAAAATAGKRAAQPRAAAATAGKRAASRAGRGAQANGSSTTSAPVDAGPAETNAPTGASRRTSASAIGP